MHDGAATSRAELQVDGVAMVRLLGPQDRLLTTIERQFPDVRVLVRGNEIRLEGEPGSVEAAKRLRGNSGRIAARDQPKGEELAKQLKQKSITTLGKK